MDDKTNQLADQLRRNPAMLQALMRSGDGQALMRMLTSGDRGTGLQQAVQSAMRGDTTEMVRLMNRVKESPGGAELMERISQAVKK